MPNCFFSIGCFIVGTSFFYTVSEKKIASNLEEIKTRELAPE